MPDPIETPEGSPQGNPQPAKETQKASALEGYVPEARLTGALQKIESLTLTMKSLQDQLTAANTRIGELQAQGASQETEWNAKAGEQANAVKGVTEERDALKARIASLEAQQKKIQMIADLGHYNLLAIADQIPVQADEAKQKEAIERMANFAKGLVEGREKELTAGTTVVTTNPAATELPTTSQAWNKYLEGIPFGTPEREAAWAKFFDWSQTQAAKKA